MQHNPYLQKIYFIMASFNNSLQFQNPLSQTLLHIRHKTKDSPIYQIFLNHLFSLQEELITLQSKPLEQQELIKQISHTLTHSLKQFIMKDLDPYLTPNKPHTHTFTLFETYANQKISKLLTDISHNDVSKHIDPKNLLDYSQNSLKFHIEKSYRQALGSTFP